MASINRLYTWCGIMQEHSESRSFEWIKMHSMIMSSGSEQVKSVSVQINALV